MEASDLAAARGAHVVALALPDMMRMRSSTCQPAVSAALTPRSCASSASAGIAHAPPCTSSTGFLFTPYLISVIKRILPARRCCPQHIANLLNR